MPRGSLHPVEGLLIAIGSFGLSLRVADGGVWQLDGNAAVRKLVNRRVRIERIRSGFDLLDVTRIEPI